MYTVSKGPSKLVAKTRRGIPQNLDRFDNFRDITKKPGDENVPRPVFHNNNRRIMHHFQRQQEIISPQHEEIIKFINDSWNLVCSQYEQYSPASSPVTDSPRSPTIVYYEDGEPNALLQDFKPFDLESWWGKRLYNNITKSL